MKISTKRAALVLSVASVMCAALLGCDKKDAKREDDESTHGDAGSEPPSKAAGDEPELARAVAAAAAAHPTGNADTAGGPPASGIFAPGEADKAFAKGGPATITVGSDGAEPRLLLGPGPKPGTKRTGTIDVASQSDPQQPPIPIQFAITFEASRAKVEGDAPAPTLVSVKVLGAKINAAGVPAEMVSALSKLKGAHVDYQVSADGAAVAVHTELPKAAVDPLTKDAMQSLTDFVTGIALPFPSKPVGVGAFWMVTTRDSLLSLDVVTYRMVKLEKIDAGVATLSIGTKRYAASPAFELEGLPPEAPKTMAEFHAQSEGKLTATPGEAFPKTVELQSLVAAVLGVPELNPTGKPQQRPTMQVQTRAALTLGGS